MTPTQLLQSKTAFSSVADDARWTRVVARDRSADGEFWYSVATTGVYCRPSCPSRAANPRNVRLHDSLDAARATGFRPCKRCNPDGHSTNHENAAISSSGRFYEKSTDMLGMTPTRYRSGGMHEEIRFAVGASSLGAILVASSQKGVVSILLDADPDALVRQLQDRFPNARLVGADKEYEHLVARVVGFVEEPALGLDLPLDVRGTAFQQRVWQALREIPAGQTVSYADVARRIGQPTSTRAVASACAANNVALCIPCHRVVRSDGAVSGYAWGVERKRALIEREAIPAGAAV